MKVLPINNNQYNNNFKSRPVMTAKSNTIVQDAVKSGKIGKNSFHKTLLKYAALFAVAVLPMFTSCKKNSVPADNQPAAAATIPKDHVDFAFRDMVALFGLDTNGYTKILKQAYVLNDGDYMIDTFQMPNNPDTMYSHGVFYNNHDQLGPFEFPYEATWTRTTCNGKDAVKVNYKYSWESKDPLMPEPKHVYYVPGGKGDNSMKMYVNPGTSYYWGDVDVVGNSAYYKVEDINIRTPFWVEIEENYNNNEIQPINK